MARLKNGQAISPSRRTPKAMQQLKALLTEASTMKDLGTWRRAKAALGYIESNRVVEFMSELDVARSTVNQWLRWYETKGAKGLRSRKAPGAAPKLTQEQMAELATLIEAGPQAAGYTSGVWTGPMVGDLIHKVYGVRYHNHHVPRLLHQLDFSVQRPRKRLARADAEEQAVWLRDRLPRINKNPPRAEAL